MLSNLGQLHLMRTLMHSYKQLMKGVNEKPEDKSANGPVSEE